MKLQKIDKLLVGGIRVGKSDMTTFPTIKQIIDTLNALIAAQETQGKRISALEPKGRCCEHGYFGQEHDCMKQKPSEYCDCKERLGIDGYKVRPDDLFCARCLKTLKPSQGYCECKKPSGIDTKIGSPCSTCGYPIPFKPSQGLREKIAELLDTAPAYARGEDLADQILSLLKEGI